MNKRPRSWFICSGSHREEKEEAEEEEEEEAQGKMTVSVEAKMLDKSLCMSGDKGVQSSEGSTLETQSCSSEFILVSL